MHNIFNRIDISEDTDTYKASASIECGICPYWCFLNQAF